MLSTYSTTQSKEFDQELTSMRSDQFKESKQHRVYKAIVVCGWSVGEMALEAVKDDGEMIWTEQRRLF